MTGGTADRSRRPIPTLVREDERSRAIDTAAAGRAQGRYCYLLDLDAGLADRLSMRMRMVARPVATAVVVEAPPGPVAPGALLGTSASGLGALVVKGVLALDVQVGDRTATELIGEGALLCPADGAEDPALLAHEARVRALEPSRLALIDDAFLERVRPWPEIMLELARRAVRRTMELNVQRAATCHPRADVRIALLLWHLADPWGKVGTDGILLPLPLTHQLIGQMVGAERPTVSHALARLSAAGLVTRCKSGLVLHGTAEHHIACLVARSEPGDAAHA
ncbi:MAG TPA: Crp/Fnr family transcriptional regulator [Miltoncostaeaceae bacterium]|nr:Crp/Fnr family transcriptional regulator [Miltoncostaeaceae bacterium]